MKLLSYEEIDLLAETDPLKLRNYAIQVTESLRRIFAKLEE